MKNVLDWIIKLLSSRGVQPTTWVGILLGIGTAIGVTIPEELAKQAATALSALISIGLIFYNENKK